MLYLKVAELLSSGLQTAIDQIRAGKLCLSSTVKQGECRWLGLPAGSGQEAVSSWGRQDTVMWEAFLRLPGAGPIQVGEQPGRW